MVDQQSKTALILSSGAMRGAYQCGVLKAFKEYDLEFDVVVGSSAGAYNGVRYLTDQMVSYTIVASLGYQVQKTNRA